MLNKLNRIWLETPRLIALSLALTLIGIIIFACPYIVGIKFPIVLNPLVRDITKSFSQVITSVGLINLILRSVIWRDAIDVALQRVELKDSMVKSGIVDVLPSKAVNYKKLFEAANNVTIVNISARHFVAFDNVGETRAFLKRGGKLTLIVSDPNAEQLMRHYDEYFGEPPGTRKTKCLEALRAVAEFVKRSPEVIENLEVRLTGRRLTYALQQFDDIRTVTLYRTEPQTRDPLSIPVLIFREGNIASGFSDPDLDFLKGHDSKVLDASELEAFGKQAQTASMS